MKNGWNVKYKYPHNIENVVYISVKFPHRKDYHGLSVYDVIFWFDFARHFWGEDKHDVEQIRDAWYECKLCKARETMTEYCWQAHLQQLVIAEDKFEYIGRFV